MKNTSRLVDQIKLRQIIERFSTHHPHWKIELQDDFRLDFIYSGPDSTGQMGNFVTHNQRLDLEYLSDKPEAFIKHYVFDLWLRAWQHEASEWLSFDKKLIMDPHEQDFK